MYYFSPTFLVMFMSGHVGESQVGGGVVTLVSHAKTYLSEQFLSETTIFEMLVSTRACRQRCSPPKLSGCPFCHWTLMLVTCEPSGEHHWNVLFGSSARLLHIQ